MGIIGTAVVVVAAISRPKSPTWRIR